MTTAMQGRSASDYWWLVLLQGITTLILGILLLTAPGLTTLILVRYLGFYWLISGIFSIISIFSQDRTVHWFWPLLSGIIGILAGVFVIGHPLFSFIAVPTMLIIIIGVQGIFMGAISLVQGFRGDGWGIGLWGIVNIILGLILLGNPIIGAAVLPTILGVFGLLGGIAMIVMAFRLRSA